LSIILEKKMAKFIKTKELNNHLFSSIFWGVIPKHEMLKRIYRKNNLSSFTFFQNRKLNAL